MNRVWQLVWLATLVLGSAHLQAKPFTFVALGDTAYEIPDDYPAYEKLISIINQSKPVFSTHIGNTKGAGDCRDEFQVQQLEFFNSFDPAVFYALGNNEWADCWKDNRGSHDPLEVLNSMRGIFFSTAKSLGKQPLDLVRQSDSQKDTFPLYAENVRWHKGAVTFLNVNVVSENNNQFAGQVLVVHGHEHTFIIDKPLRVWDDASNTTLHDNITRLQVYGWPDMKAVTVSVDTSKPWVFGFEPLFGDDNISPDFKD